MVKTRNLSHKEYLEALELEYLSASYRSHIYNEPHSKVQSDIAKMKQDKIKSVGERFNLETIFDSEDNYNNFVKNYFWNTYGLPNLVYGKNIKIDQVVFWDNKESFKKGSKVGYENGEYTILESDANEKVVMLDNKKIVKYSCLILNQIKL